MGPRQTRPVRADYRSDVKSEESDDSEVETSAPEVKKETSPAEVTKVKKPFKELAGYPVSDSRPIYGKIKNPLSVKDSAVLYSSLQSSRTFWVEGKIFELFWSKSQERQHKYVISKSENKADKKSNIRDKMNKLCDCSLLIGPHSFEIRLFVLKNEEIERRHEQQLKEKKELKQQKKSAREDELKRRQEFRQQRPDGSFVTMSNGPPHVYPLSVTPSPYKPLTISTPPKASSSSSPVPGPLQISTPSPVPAKSVSIPLKSTVQPVGQTVVQPSVLPANTVVKSTVANPTANSIASPSADSTANSAADSTANSAANFTAKPIAQPTKVAGSPPKPATLSANSTAQPAKPTLPLTVSKPLATPSPSSKPPINTPPHGAVRPSMPVSAPSRTKTSSEIMQSPENTIMIRNLNSIARIDSYLDALMKIVASGKSSPHQIQEFQNYIKKAREMGRRGIDDPKIFFRLLELEKKQEALRASGITEGRPPIQGPRPVGRPRKIRDPLEEARLYDRRSRKEDPKLTAFQERYLKGADLVFEYTELPTERFRLPKESIIERVDETKFLVSSIIIFDEESKKAWQEMWEEEQEKEKAEMEKAEKEKAEKEQAEKEKVEKEKAEKAENEKESGSIKDESTGPEVKKEEESGVNDGKENTSENVEKSEDQNDDGQKEPGSKDEVDTNGKKASHEDAKKSDTKPKPKRTKRKAKRFAPRKSRRIATMEKKQINVLDSDESEEETEEPNVDEEKKFRYVAVSFLLYDIPYKFMELIGNSFAPHDLVYKKMELMIKHGKKLPSHYLWYTLDGIQDEKLAENLRHELYELENTKDKKRYSKGPKVISQMAAMHAADMLKSEEQSPSTSVTST